MLCVSLHFRSASDSVDKYGTVFCQNWNVLKIQTQSKACNISGGHRTKYKLAEAPVAIELENTMKTGHICSECGKVLRNGMSTEFQGSTQRV
jgi:hypothetical protein